MPSALRSETHSLFSFRLKCWSQSQSTHHYLLNWVLKYCGYCTNKAVYRRLCLTGCVHQLWWRPCRAAGTCSARLLGSSQPPQMSVLLLEQSSCAERWRWPTAECHHWSLDRHLQRERGQRSEVKTGAWCVFRFMMETYSAVLWAGSWSAGLPLRHLMIADLSTSSPKTAAGRQTTDSWISAVDCRIICSLPELASAAVLKWCWCQPNTSCCCFTLRAFQWKGLLLWRSYRECSFIHQPADELIGNRKFI